MIRTSRVIDKSSLPRSVRASLLAGLSALTLTITAAAQSQPLIPALDFDVSTVTSNYKGAGGGSLFLPVLGNDLFGESHDIDTGGLSFRHVDVSLPGNSALPVEFSRSTFTTNTFNDGRYLTDNAIHIGTELGLNWEVGIPYVLVRGDTSFSGRCQDDSRSDRFEDGNVAVAIDSGRKLHRPGETAEFIGKAPSGSPRSYRSFGTKSYWTGSCLSGGGGYKFKDPKGNIYIFDHHVVRNGGKHILNVYSANPSTVTYVRNHYHRLTKVEDVSGNWVEYSYNTNGINGIESSDGRSISVSYSGRHISSVTANGRTWRYRYNTVPSRAGDDVVCVGVDLAQELLDVVHELRLLDALGVVLRPVAVDVEHGDAALAAGQAAGGLEEDDLVGVEFAHEVAEVESVAGVGDLQDRDTAFRAGLAHFADESVGGGVELEALHTRVREFL